MQLRSQIETDDAGELLAHDNGQAGLGFTHHGLHPGLTLGRSHQVQVRQATPQPAVLAGPQFGTDLDLVFLLATNLHDELQMLSKRVQILSCLFETFRVQASQ